MDAQASALPSWIRWCAEPPDCSVLFARGARPGGLEADWDEWSYRRLAELVHGYAAAFERIGLPRGAAVAVQAPNGPQAVAGFYGAIWAGLRPTVVSEAFGANTGRNQAEAVDGILRVLRPAAVVCAERHATAAVAALRAFAPDAVAVTGPEPSTTASPCRMAPDGVAFTQFTSGSTAQPRALSVTVQGLARNLAAVVDRLGLGPEDQMVSWLPMHHDMGLVGAVIQSLAGGMTLRLMDPALFLRAPGVWLRALGRQGATVTYAPSFGYSWLARRLTPAMLEGVDLSGWRYAVVGAERLSARPFGELAAGLAGHGFAPCLMASYGLAENTLAVSTRDPRRPLPMIALTRDEDGSGTRVVRETTWEAALAASQARDDWLLSSGKPLRGMSVEIRDPGGAVLPSGRIGEIHLRSPTVALPGVEDGEPPTRLATGDAGLLWNGQLYVLGRMGDSAKVNGITVYAEEVETALARVLPRSVAWHTVLLGGVEERLTAVVVAEGRGWREGADWAPEVRTIVQAALGEGVAVRVYAAPPGAVPRTSSGKPRRRQAWLLWAAGSRGG